MTDMATRIKYGPMAVIGILFFVFGFVSWLNAILIPYFKFTLQLPLSVAILVAFAFYVSYFVMAIPSFWLLQRIGFKAGMATGLFIMAVGSLLFIPAAYAMDFVLFLIGLFVQAAGLTVLQTAANPYVTILGPIESAATRMSVMGVCNKLAGALAPMLFLRVVTNRPDEIDEVRASLINLTAGEQQLVLAELTERLIIPYGVMAGVLLLLVLGILRSGLPDIKEESDGESTPNWRGLFHFPQLVLGIIAVFCSVGVEVLVIDSIISYAEYHQLSFTQASYLPTYVLLIMIGSYIMGIWLIPKRITQQTALCICSLLGIATTIAAICWTGSFSIWLIVLLGLANALLWPSIWPLALNGVGRYTKRGSALMIMGIIGGAVVPYAYGVLGDWQNLQLAYVVMLPLYGFLFYFATYGVRIARRNIGFETAKEAANG